MNECSSSEQKLKVPITIKALVSFLIEAITVYKPTNPIICTHISPFQTHKIPSITVTVSLLIQTTPKYPWIAFEFHRTHTIYQQNPKRPYLHTITLLQSKFQAWHVASCPQLFIICETGRLLITFALWTWLIELFGELLINQDACARRAGGFSLLLWAERRVQVYAFNLKSKWNQAWSLFGGAEN